MNLGSLWSLKLAGALTIGASVLNVLAFLGSTFVAFWSKKSLEQVKARHLDALEVRKQELQKDLEEKKQDLQVELEGFKADLTDDLATRNARRAYEYEARKRLYEQVEPLLFQLIEAAESAFHAVASLVCTQQAGNLPYWLERDGYYLRSIIHRLFLPLVIFRLLQRSTTLLDFSLDPSIRLRYALLKECYLTWTDDFSLARLEPSIAYEPNRRDWRELRKVAPDKHWRQGLVMGHLDRLLDTMVVGEVSARRPMNYGELEVTMKDGSNIESALDAAKDVIFEFNFGARPVLARLLLSYAWLMHILMFAYGKDRAIFNAEWALEELLDCEDKRLLMWWEGTDTDVFEIVRPYVLRRLNQAIA